MNHADLSPRPGASSVFEPRACLCAAFFLFWLRRYRRFITHPTNMAAEKARKTLVANSYLGGAESWPRSQVAKIPPVFVMMNPIAIAVAFRVCGAALLAFHVVRDGAER